jgi:hypothetical protein
MDMLEREKFVTTSNSGSELKRLMNMDPFIPMKAKPNLLELDGRAMKLTRDFSIQDRS